MGKLKNAILNAEESHQPLPMNWPGEVITFNETQGLALYEALQWTASALGLCAGEALAPIEERRIRMKDTGDVKSIGEILDMADAALGTAKSFTPEQTRIPQDDEQPEVTHFGGAEGEGASY